MSNVTLRRVRGIIVVVGKQKVSHIVCVCVGARARACACALVALLIQHVTRRCNCHLRPL